MGCEQSRGVSRTDGEVEIGLDSNSECQTVVQVQQKESPSRLYKDNGLNFTSQQTKDSDSSPNCPKPLLIQHVNTNSTTIPPNEESSKTAKTEFSTMLISTDKITNTGPMSFTNELEMRMGKTCHELSDDFTIIQDAIIRTLKECKCGKIQTSQITSMLSKWQVRVYEEIWKKSGEIKSKLAFNTLLNIFYVKHEVIGWEYDDLLLEFCQENGFKHDPLFISESQNKLSDIPSLTVCIVLEIVLTGRVNTEFYVSFDALHHFNRERLDKILEGSCEKENIGVWYDAHTPMPIDFGFTLNSTAQSNQFSLGFYIFDGSPRVNLKRATSAFQSYGAELNAAQIALLKRIPSEELRVYFYINTSGISKISLFIQKLSPELVDAMVETFPKSSRKVIWDNLIQSLHTQHNLQYYLEFSTEGYQFGCEGKVGKDFGSVIFF